MGVYKELGKHPHLDKEGFVLFQSLDQEWHERVVQHQVEMDLVVVEKSLNSLEMVSVLVLVGVGVGFLEDLVYVHSRMDQMVGVEMVLLHILEA